MSEHNKVNKKKQTIRKLVLASVLMFGFGFALSPIYDVFCALTGINGQTQRIETAKELEKAYDPDRVVTLQFDGNVNSHLSWAIKPEQLTMEVHPGQLYQANYIARNLDTQLTTGQAVPSVVPKQASLYFNKTECFCFTQQELAGKETKVMPIKFIIDPAMPEEITTLTLSYTFFPGQESQKISTSQGDTRKRSEG